LNGLISINFLFSAELLYSGTDDPSEILLDRNEYESFSIGKNLLLFEDGTNSLTFDDIQTHSLLGRFHISVKDTPVWGQTQSTIWARINFNNEKPEPMHLLLESRYATTDYLTIFSPSSDGTYRSLTLGDRIAFAKREIKHRYPIFKISVPPGKSTFFIRLKTGGLTSLPLFLWSPGPFQNYIMKEYILLGILLGFVVVMLFYNIFLYASFRTKDYMYYVVYISGFIWSNLGTLGLGIYFMPEHDDNWIMNQGYVISINFALFGAMLFAREFLNFQKKNLFTMILLNVPPFLPLMTMIYIIIVNNYQIGTILTESNAMILTPIFITLGLIRAFQGYKPAIIYVVAWIFVAMGTFLIAAKIAGIIPYHPVVDWCQLIGGAMEVVLLSLALGYRMNLIKSEARKQISRLNQQLTKHVEHVEAIVEERTQTINTILNHVVSGFLLLNRDLSIAPGYSKSCEKLFGRKILPEDKLTDLLNISGNGIIAFEASIEQIFDDILPEEITLSQLPRNYLVDRRTLAITGSLVRNNDHTIRAVLITITDETDLIKARHTAKINSTLLHILRHPDAFRMFYKEFRQQIANLKNYLNRGEKSAVRITLHTIKGNAGAFFLDEVHNTISIVENKEAISTSDIEKIETCFDGFISTHFINLGFVTKKEDQLFEVSIKKLHDLYHKTFEFTSFSYFREWLTEWLYRVETKPVSQ
ncbi:MAG: Hpt domain-containing protein, partial [Oligoflexales bacterium]|nr:Hpt domain-containing protein [Oligoflexales bacterium]